MRSNALSRSLRSAVGSSSVRRATLRKHFDSLRLSHAPLCTSFRCLSASCVRLAANATPAASLSAHDFASITPQLLLRQSLQQYTELDGTQVGSELHPGENHLLISREKFLQFCAAAHVEDPDAALDNLAAAGVVVALDGGKLIHLRPVLYLETLALLSSAGEEASGHARHADSAADSKASTQSSLPSAPAASSTAVGAFMLEEAEQRIAKLQAQEEEMVVQLRPAIARAAKWRRGVWGGALLFAGTQLAVISRLTYFDLDWDIMEPVSYCITIGTALVFYAYYLRYNQEHTYEEFDQRFLPKKVRQYAPKDFDWAKYESVCAQLVEERAMMERIRKWAERH